MQNSSSKIPKVIHLCWFSGESFPKPIEHCIRSWRRVLPDYEIKIWDYDMAMASNIPFVREALSVKKWAFAADAIRLYALYTEGGLYMDSDVFVKRRFDEFLNNSVVMFVEHYPDKDPSSKRVDRTNTGIQAAFFAAEKGSSLIKEMLNYYLDRPFILEDGSFHTGIIAPVIYATEVEKAGFELRDELQELGELTVYPSRYVGGNRKQETKHTFAVHLCNHSWHDRSKIREIGRNIKAFITNVFRSETKVPV